GAPAAGVRVFAQQITDRADANSVAAPFEGLVETDASGRYRMQLTAGSYYIASGSVSTPTYFPGTTSVASARVVTVTAGGVVEGIDFGSFVEASRAPGLPGFIQPAPGGGLSGTVRFPDGTSGANIQVIAFPASVPLPPAIVASGTTLPRPVRTDA